MKLYHNLFAYLNGVTPISHTELQGSNRPILVLDSDESISANSLLIPHCKLVYEIGFSYLKSTNLQNCNQLQFELDLIFNEVHHWLQITDEVIDEGAIESEKQLEEWNNQHLLDSSVALLIQSYIGLLSE